jgi:hypothetical protein
MGEMCLGVCVCVSLSFFLVVEFHFLIDTIGRMIAFCVCGILFGVLGDVFQHMGRSEGRQHDTRFIGIYQWASRD